MAWLVFQLLRRRSESVKRCWIAVAQASLCLPNHRAILPKRCSHYWTPASDAHYWAKDSCIVFKISTVQRQSSNAFALSIRRSLNRTELRRLAVNLLKMGFAEIISESDWNIDEGNRNLE